MHDRGSPFAFVAGDSFLHKWASADPKWWAFRIITKSVVFLCALVIVARLGAKLSFTAALISYSVIIIAGLAIVAWSSGFHTCRLFFRDICVIVLLGFIVGLPIYFALVSGIAVIAGRSADSFVTSAKSITVLLAATVGSLTIAAIFLSTTSLAALLRRVDRRSPAKYFLALVLSQLPRFEENIETAHLAFASLTVDEYVMHWHAPRRWPSAARIYIRRTILLLLGEIWRILRSLGPQFYLVLAARSKEETNLQ
jgi:hypothetical protein